MPAVPGGAAPRGRAVARWVFGLGAVGYLATLAVNRSLLDVRGPSMEPALWPGDRLVTVPVRRRWVRPGRVVVVEDPHEPGHLVVKRVVHVDDGHVEVSGDNPDASTDSRQWGPLPSVAVRRLVVRRWPDVRTLLHR